MAQQTPLQILDAEIQAKEDEIAQLGKKGYSEDNFVKLRGQLSAELVELEKRKTELLKRKYWFFLFLNN